MIVNCEYCGKEYPKLPAEIKRTKHNYCSKPCTGLGRQIRNTETFYSKAVKNGECLEWTNAINKSGYGVQRYKGKTMLAHRVSYMIAYGSLKGLQVLHTCDNPLCVNPDHLFLGYHQDNMDDMIFKGRKSTKLSFDSVVEIRESNSKNKDLAIKYGVAERTIRYAKNKSNWIKPLPPETK